MDRPSSVLIFQVVLGVLMFLLFLFRRPVGRWLRPAVSRLLPRGFAWMPSGGAGVGKCTRCGAAVSYSRFAPGEVAFTCESCGESATWQSASWQAGSPEPPAGPDGRE